MWYYEINTFSIVVCIPKLYSVFDISIDKMYFRNESSILLDFINVKFYLIIFSSIKRSIIVLIPCEFKWIKIDIQSKEEIN